jgi:hypothetical protein
MWLWHDKEPNADGLKGGLWYNYLCDHAFQGIFPFICECQDPLVVF